MRQAGTYSRLLTGGLSGRTGPHLLPLARIKKIMKKSGDDVKMISGEAPIVFSKACELFIEDLTQKSWKVAMQGKRRTLQKEDVASALMATDIFDFLVNLVDNNSSVDTNNNPMMMKQDQPKSRNRNNQDQNIVAKQIPMNLQEHGNNLMLRSSLINYDIGPTQTFFFSEQCLPL